MSPILMTKKFGIKDKQKKDLIPAVNPRSSQFCVSEPINITKHIRASSSHQDSA